MFINFSVVVTSTEATPNGCELFLQKGPYRVQRRTVTFIHFLSRLIFSQTGQNELVAQYL
jgi:hypothetical protein